MVLTIVGTFRSIKRHCKKVFEFYRQITALSNSYRCYTHQYRQYAMQYTYIQ